MMSSHVNRIQIQKVENSATHFSRREVRIDESEKLIFGELTLAGLYDNLHSAFVGPQDLSYSFAENIFQTFYLLLRHLLMMF